MSRKESNFKVYSSHVRFRSTVHESCQRHKLLAILSTPLHLLDIRRMRSRLKRG